MAPPISTKRTPEREALGRLFHSATAAVAPEALIRRHLVAADGQALLGEGVVSDPVRLPFPVALAGAGKAAARMARGCEQTLGADRVRGLVITADGCEVPLRQVECLVAGHPIPDQRGVTATERLLGTLGNVAGPLLFLLSGGASSLLVRPRPPVTLADQAEVSRLLLACGADIAEFNCVRKHLSQVKGGGLLRATRGAVHTLVLSDVVGDDPTVIGSAPTVADPTTHADAMAVLRRYDLVARVPPVVRDSLEAGVRGEVPETVKPGDPDAARGDARVVGSNSLALAAAAAAAKEAGWLLRALAAPLVGDVRQAAVRLAGEVQEEVRAARSTGRRHCILAGGETTVRLTGGGRGGRNQELALALAGPIRGLPAVVLSAGSDGIDGPTDAAGAFVDGTTLDRAGAIGLDPAAHLADNDSYTFFDRLGDLFSPGPTGTNVADFQLILVG